MLRLYCSQYHGCLPSSSLAGRTGAPDFTMGCHRAVSLLSLLLTGYYVNLWSVLTSSPTGGGEVHYQEKLPVAVHKHHQENLPVAVHRHLQAIGRVTTGPPPKAKTQVFVTSYMHAGSSILGSVFQKNPLAVYLYEPLDAVYVSILNTARYMWPYTYISRSNDSAFRARSPFEQEMVSYYLDTILSCDFRRLPELLTAHMYFAGEQSCEVSCNIKKPPPYGFFHVAMFRNETMRHQLCPAGRLTANTPGCDVGMMLSFCYNSEILAMKLLRYDVAELETRLSRYPHLYVIHELRDPRGIIQSHVTQGGMSEKILELLARDLCNVMAHDLEVMQSLIARFPDRVKIIRYEDFAAEPLKVTSQMYRFIRRHPPKDVIRWVADNTHSARDEGKYARRNATETAQRWRRTISPMHRAMVETECAHLREQLERFGYVM